MRSYDYTNRRGIEEISWERFGVLVNTLAELLSSHDVDLIVGIARAGLIPATAASCALRKELYPVRVTRRVDDRVIFEHPVWRVPVPSIVSGKKVAVVDEIADTGETLALVAGAVREAGARMVVTAALVAHSWADPFPDMNVRTTDALVVFPWDRVVLSEGRWVTHPELEAARKQQNQP